MRIILKYILLIVFIISAISIKAGNPFSFRQKILLLNNSGDTFDKLIFGVDEKATFGIDDQLGEFLIPTHPPDGLHGLFQFAKNDSVFTDNFSYRDFRPIAETNKFFMIYRINVQRSSDKTLTLQWQTPDMLHIDSIRLSDKLIGFHIVDVDMAKNSIVEVVNEYLNEFDIRVWYSTEPVRVGESKPEDTEITIFPQPCTNYIVLSSNNYISYNIYDLYGQEKCSDNNLAGINKIIDTKDLLPGTYFIKLYSEKGDTYFRKFIKIN